MLTKSSTTDQRGSRDRSSRLPQWNTNATVPHHEVPALFDDSSGESPTTAMAMTDEIVVAVAIGIPSCLIALGSLWVAYRTFSLTTRIRDPRRPSKQTDDEESCLPSLSLGRQDESNATVNSAATTSLQVSS